MSKVIEREQCPACASRGQDNSCDNLAVYDDGHKYCYACEYRESGKGDTVPIVKDTSNTKFYKGTYVANRGITEKTMRMYGYEAIRQGDKKAEIASFYSNGSVVAQHLRGPNKTFRWIGDVNNVSLWGQHLWKSGNGKRLVITEGEYDCMTVAQLFNLKWAVVSLPNGAAGAVKAVKDNLEFVSGYDEVVLMFDNDQPGKDAATAVAEILPPGKCKIATLPYKDANECLMNNDSQAVINSVWEAQRFSPDEILHISNVSVSPELSETKVYPFPFDSLTEYLVGQRSGEITLWASGTGSGKTTIVRELIHHHLEEGRSVGAIMLEESPQETMDDMISLMINKPVRVIRASRMMNNLRESLGKDPIDIHVIDDLTDEEYAEARESLNNTSLYIYDHLGNNALKNLCSRIEYMAVSLGVDVIVLDHITAAATGLMSGDSDYDNSSNERLLIDSIMKELRGLVSRTGVRIDVISQLKKTNKAYEEGDRITLQDLRGSGSLSSVPNTVIGLERDRQNPDNKIANTTVIRVLKNRLTGKAGVATCLYYNHVSGRLEELSWAQDDDGTLRFEAV